MKNQEILVKIKEMETLEKEISVLKVRLESILAYLEEKIQKIKGQEDISKLEEFKKTFLSYQKILHIAESNIPQLKKFLGRKIDSLN